MTKDVKKGVLATLDFPLTVVKGHLLAAACEIIGITKLDSYVPLPPNVKHGQPNNIRICTEYRFQCSGAGFH